MSSLLDEPNKEAKGLRKGNITCIGVPFKGCVSLMISFAIAICGKVLEPECAYLFFIERLWLYFLLWRLVLAHGSRT